MKITITKEFDSADDAIAWLHRAVWTPAGVSAPDVAISDVAAEPITTAEIEAAHAKNLAEYTPPAPPTTPRPRKPRSDAGKPRGSYKNAAPEEPISAADGQHEPPAPVSAPETAAPEKSPADHTATMSNGSRFITEMNAEGDKPQPSGVATAPTAAAPAAELTVTDARNALKRMSDTKGMGTPACIQHLKEFGVNKLSDLKPDQFALFIAQADAKVAEHAK
ncbi:MAG TPA: hypothetical protein VIC04_09210 [Terriglobia bacterium]